MLKTRIAKIAGLTLGVTFALGLSVNTAGAQTVAELQAQINALMAQLAALSGANANVSYTFTQNLTIGSTGADVVSLQQYLVGGGYLNMPAGVAYGYFGPLTQAAVAKWQAANGVSPAVGYWGPLSRAKANSMVSGGATGTVPGTTIGGGATAGGTINTPGVEGTLTASLASTPTGVKLYEGADKVAVMGIQLEADLSDIRVERIKLKLDGTSSDQNFYRKVAERLYIMDGSTVLASVDLNSSTVIEETSGNYYVTVTGLNFIVRKDTKKTVQVALDAMNTWDNTYDNATWTITVPASGVRGVDGAGINQYATATFSRDFTSQADVIANATLNLTLNPSTPSAALVIAAEGADEDEKSGVEVLRFDVKAEKDAVTITDLTATTTLTGAADVTTIYLMDGNTVLGSESGPTTAGTSAVTFDNIDYVVPKDSTRTLRLVVDIQNADGTASTIVSSVVAAGITDENSVGDAVTTSGSATSETITVLNAGPEITLSSKSISKTEIQFSGATSSAKATFNVTLKAVGSDIYFGTQSASTTFGFAPYKGGTYYSNTAVASSTSWSIPSGVVTSGLSTGQAFKLQEGSSVTIPVDFLFEGRESTGALLATDAYSVGLENVNWSTTGASTVGTNFMAGETAWRTSTVTMP